MSGPSPRPALQQRVSAAIVEAAARVLAAGGEQASMAEIAAEAGVARATVYRYFPSRQAVLEAIAEAAVLGAGDRLAAARIDELPLEEALGRAVRAMVDVGDPFVVLVREHGRVSPGPFEERVAAPLRRLFERGRKAGDLRDDLPGGWLAEFLVGLVIGVLTAAPALGRDDTIAAVTSLFLDGARNRRPRLEAVP